MKKCWGTNCCSAKARKKTGSTPIWKEAPAASSTPLSPIYDLMVSCEAGEWDVVARHAKKLNLSLAFVNRGFNDAVSWAHEMTTAVPSEKK